MIVAEHGWAVRFLHEGPGARQWVWLNYGGGYSPTRRTRAVFASSWEAKEAAKPWQHHRLLKLVRVKYCAAPPVPVRVLLAGEERPK